MPLERVVTKYTGTNAMTNSKRDGIVLWERQEQKCQQRLYQHSDVVQYTPLTKVCFSNQNTGCKNTVSISEKECGSYYIYKLYATKCPRRYCGSDWVRRFMYTRNFAQSSFFFIIIIDQKCFKFHLKMIASVIITGKNMVDNRG